MLEHLSLHPKGEFGLLVAGDTTRVEWHRGFPSPSATHLDFDPRGGKDLSTVNPVAFFRVELDGESKRIGDDNNGDLIVEKSPKPVAIFIPPFG